jgi:hypothetical protein
VRTAEVAAPNAFVAPVLGVCVPAPPKFPNMFPPVVGCCGCWPNAPVVPVPPNARAKEGQKGGSASRREACSDTVRLTARAAAKRVRRLPERVRLRLLLGLLLLLLLLGLPPRVCAGVIAEHRS